MSGTSMMEEGQSAGGERDDDDVLTIEIDITEAVRDFLKGKEEHDGDEAAD